MAEYCLDCWNKLNGSDDNEKRYILSKDYDLCEGCGEWKPVIIAERKPFYNYLIPPVKIIYYILYFILKVISLPYLIFKYYKRK